MWQVRSAAKNGISKSRSFMSAISPIAISQSSRSIGMTLPSNARHIRAFHARGFKTSLKQRSLGGTSALFQTSAVFTAQSPALCANAHRRMANRALGRSPTREDAYAASAREPSFVRSVVEFDGLVEIFLVVLHRYHL